MVLDVVDGRYTIYVRRHLEVGVGVCPVAARGPVLAVAAVDQLLLAVVEVGAAGQLLEADLDGRHVGEGHAAAALLLVPHLPHTLAYIMS